jgi:oligopeptide transport system substrate-binding protein
MQVLSRAQVYWRFSRSAKSMFHRPLILVCVLLLGACGEVWNNPHPREERQQALLYESFSSRPKHLDPAQSYVADEAWFVYSTYETLLDYHYLKRPYVLTPNLAEAMPSVTYRDAAGAVLPHDAPVERIAETEYLFRLVKGVMYQPHPAFARDAQARPRYMEIDWNSIGDRGQIGDFAHTGTREMRAEDFVYQLKRIARPGLDSPAFTIFERIPGMTELAATLRADAAAGRIDPKGWIDLRRYALPGVDAPDAHTLRIRIKGKFPQFVYWLAMSFVVPVPWEAERFYALPGMAKRELSLDMWPVGTGPFMLTRNRPLRELRLERNPNFRRQSYPCEGEPGDAEAGLLADCGKPLPLVDGVVFKYERETTPFWNKFLQGYYDFYSSSRFGRLDSFDNALKLQGGALSLSPEMVEKGIRLTTEVEPSISYYFINMLDPVLGNGGATPAARERARKVRQAMAIALDIEESLAIMQNGLGIAMQGFLPPGVPGYTPGEKGINRYVYSWERGRARRRSIDEAKALLAEAGYPNGRDVQTGKPLLVYLDAVSSGGDRSGLELLTKQLARIDLQLVPRLTEWNRFQDKHRKGFAQFSGLGWNADYPDPENFLFLFYGPNGKVKYQSENITNYENPEYDRLYEQFSTMNLDADRQPVLDRMLDILRRDAPVLAGSHSEEFQLSHGWLSNVKLGTMVRSTRKYLAVDVALRNRMRAQWNHPTTWPLAVVAAALAMVAALAVRHYRRHEAARALPGDDA